jgi:hypothetical protein
MGEEVGCARAGQERSRTELRVRIVRRSNIPADEVRGFPSVRGGWPRETAATRTSVIRISL